MARQFNGSCDNDKLDGSHHLVQWVLKDRRKKEKDPIFTWYPYAAKVERKGKVLLGMGIEEQAMVIIKKQLTPEAQKVADDKAAARAREAAKKAKAKKEAAKKRAAEAALKKERKEQAARIKELEQGMAKLKMRIPNAEPTDEPTKSVNLEERHTDGDDKAKSDLVKQDCKNHSLNPLNTSTKASTENMRPKSGKWQIPKKNGKRDSTNRQTSGAAKSDAAASRASDVKPANDVVDPKFSKNGKKAENEEDVANSHSS